MDWLGLANESPLESCMCASWRFEALARFKYVRYIVGMTWLVTETVSFAKWRFRQATLQGNVEIHALCLSIEHLWFRIRMALIFVLLDGRFW
jgi:hypothetical protein